MKINRQIIASFVALCLEHSLVKHGRMDLILSWIIPKTSKMVSAAFLALTLAFQSCAEDKETVSGLYVSESKN